MHELSILLWNVWNLPSWLTDNKSHTRALAISPLLNAYDVVVLNEAFVNRKALLGRVTHGHRYIPARPWQCLFSSGLVFLSRHEIVGSGYEKFTSRSGVDVFAAKGVAYVTIDVTRAGKRYGRVTVYGTHMQASHGSRAQAARMSQAVQIARFMGSNDGGDETRVLVGDLNMGPRAPEGIHHSQHYADAEDAEARTDAYARLLDHSRLCDVSVFETRDRDEYEYSNEICRMLVLKDALPRARFEYVLQAHTDGGNRLSDTKALCLRLMLEESVE